MRQWHTRTGNVKTEYDELEMLRQVTDFDWQDQLADLSENGDYHAAKEEQGKMAGRILHLTSVLENCEILEQTPNDSVTSGVVVEIRFDGDQATERYLFGSIEERRDNLEVISPRSPMGQALEGAVVGATVSYQAEAGALTVEIVSIEV